VWGAGGSELPETLCMPATTEAAVAPGGAIVFEEVKPAELITPLRATCAAEPIEPFGVGPWKEPLGTGMTPAPTEEDRTKELGAGAAVTVAWLAFAAAMVGNPEPVVTAL
jgi:hypothetical protein